MAEKGRKAQRLDVVARVVQIFTGVSLIVGIVVGVLNLQRGDLQRRLETLQHIKVFLAEDAEVQRAITSLNVGKLGTYEQLAREDVGPNETPRTGRDLYFSERLRTFCRIGQHYEQMGATVKRKYIDFDLLFDIVAFPDQFWIESKPLRTQIAENWRGPGNGLKDLWDNFTYLCERYQEARRKSGARFIEC